jgi:hypothetical protein
MKARSYAEIALYVEEHPCPQCGTRVEMARLGQHGHEVDASTNHLVFTGTCRKCRNELQYEFDVPARAPEPPAFAYGGDEASQLFTASEWRALANRKLAEISTQPASLGAKEFFEHDRNISRALSMLAEARKLGHDDPAMRAKLDSLRSQYASLMQQMSDRRRAEIAAEPPKPPKAKLDKRSLTDHQEWLDRGRKGLGQLVVEDESVGGLPFPDLNAPWSKLTRVGLSGSRVDFAHFEDAELVDVTAVKTNFGHSHFERARLTDCELRNASLFLTNFQDATLTNCDLRAASLDRGAWQRVTMRNCDLRKARVGDCRLDDAEIEDCDFSGANLGRIEMGLDLSTTAGAVFRRCDFRGAHFDGRRLNGTKFIDCKLDGVNGKPEIIGPYSVEGGDTSMAAIEKLWGPSKG